jgi:hypothetical protein
MAEIEGAIADFVRDQRESFDSQLPPSDGSRAFLRAQLAEMADLSEVHSWRWFLRLIRAPHSGAICASALTLVLVCGLILLRTVPRSGNTSLAPLEQAALPERSLTPGATRSVAMSEVCSVAHEDVVRAVSDSMRQEVLREYGIMDARADDYEIDYLIAPGLGGAENLQNLWPEPYRSQTWNAHVKDALEERLHELVCSGDLDLHTAQHEVAADWIAAYKKYFHTDRPLSLHSQIDLVPSSDFIEMTRNRIVRDRTTWVGSYTRHRSKLLLS